MPNLNLVNCQYMTDELQVGPMDEFCATVERLFAGADRESIQSATQWIDQFTKSDGAWQVVVEVLGSPPSEEAEKQHFMAAKVLHVKICKDWSKLPEEQQVPLRDTLLREVDKFQAGSRAVFTRLALCIGALVAQMRSWETAVADLVHRYGQSVEQGPLLLEILRYIAEEATSSEIYLSRKSKAAARQRLDDSVGDVIGLIKSIMDAVGPSEEVLRRAMECIRAWLANVPVSGADFAATGLIELPFAHIQNPELFSACSDLVVQYIKRFNSLRRSAPVPEQLIPRVRAHDPLSAERPYSTAHTHERYSVCSIAGRISTV